MIMIMIMITIMIMIMTIGCGDDDCGAGLDCAAQWRNLNKISTKQGLLGKSVPGTRHHKRTTIGENCVVKTQNSKIRK